ncbi:MAG TPA: homocysteine S-methyltransferase family protein [Gammaproteobacteria bacterium]|nr:homocysteine S-methyltransferase family protein [Gammaproteobacteria bacterium]
MARYRHALPQLGDNLFLTDGGIETTLIFHEGLDLPDFAAFHVLGNPEGEAGLRRYFRGYADIARRYGTGLILESATWRASADWGTRLGYSREELAEANRRAVRMLEEIGDEYPNLDIVVSGAIGPRGDGYVPERVMTEEQAEAYHGEQIRTFADTAADMVCAITMNYTEEATGIARAAKQAGMPVALSFTVETDGRLPTGQALTEAIEQVDESTARYPAYYMINCAHPTHFEHVLADAGPTLQRIRGLRANASRMSHAELNEAAELDIGDPAELGLQYADLRALLTRLNVVGGCCGTDHRHVERIAAACVPQVRAAS